MFVLYILTLGWLTRQSSLRMQYEKLVSYWIGEKYTLRYTGGMVPDVFQV